MRVGRVFRSLAVGASLAGMVAGMGYAGSALAEPSHDQRSSAGHGAPRGEPHRGPTRYHAVSPPKGWNVHPKVVNKATYQHNYQAARSFKIGPYHPPAGWAPHVWHYGDILPRAYWASEYLLADYWLFALNVPPAGYEWVRDGADALMVDTQTGEILQVEYGVFA
ncbi:MAG TPA: RcnB family protein [Steroidobacteraceae bacterium]|nr:RcnB family protein [Steroidobacteraceae bacterium]